MIFVLYQNIHTLQNNSYFNENFVLYQKFRTPDKQVLRLERRFASQLLSTGVKTELIFLLGELCKSAEH